MVNKTEYILSKFPDCAPNLSGAINTSCPFHDDARPSFTIDTEEGLFICGSKVCGVRGNFHLFYKLMENIESWKDVYEALNEKTTDFKVSSLFDKNELKKEYRISSFPSEDMLETIGDIEYLISRNIGREVINKFGLKYGVKGRPSGINIAGSIVCPVWDIDGSYQTFQIRYLNPKAPMRWCNPLGSSIQNMLYGGWAVNPTNEYLWIVEGASDVWRLASYGIQAVGLNTKEASPSQMNKVVKLCKFMNLKPVVCMDGDAPEANEKLFYEVMAGGFDPILIKLEGFEDPGGLSYDRLLKLWEVSIGKE